MTVFSTIHVAFKALLRNPTRALLTTLGIVIGIAAVITMMEIGNGSSQSIKSSIEKMGANTILVLPGASRRGGVSQGSGSRMTLTPEDCEAILRECTTVGRAVRWSTGRDIRRFRATSTTRLGRFPAARRIFWRSATGRSRRDATSPNVKSRHAAGSAWSVRRSCGKFSAAVPRSTANCASRIPPSR